MVGQRMGGVNRTCEDHEHVARKEVFRLGFSGRGYNPLIPVAISSPPPRPALSQSPKGKNGQTAAIFANDLTKRTLSPSRTFPLFPLYEPSTPPLHFEESPPRTPPRICRALHSSFNPFALDGSDLNTGSNPHLGPNSRAIFLSFVPI